ncbi:hypothetical protein [Novispirillum itersonii]|uniref:Uncharacterized protein n=1 Tax=Novispirillum itersonii TaxID=189 RepID=A0A7W9ZFB3_NOVIT|nr:hypothetical protein [Novispirillum itersonii]MBB6210446.1 hypothetical protein [Novispirillum itersonii]
MAAYPQAQGRAGLGGQGGDSAVGQVWGGGKGAVDRGGGQAYSYTLF